MRRFSTKISFISTALVAICIFWLSYEYFRSQELERAKGRLSLFRGTVVAELEKFYHLTFLLARDPYVIRVSEGENAAILNTRFTEFAIQAGLEAIYLMQTDGLTISASNATLDTSFIGRNYAFKPHFKEALNGYQGRFYGFSDTAPIPGYFIADLVRNAKGRKLGVVTVIHDLSKLEHGWRNANEQVLLANLDGVVLLSSNPGWRYRTLQNLTDKQRSRIRISRQFPGQALLPLNWQISGDQRATIDGNDRIHLTASNLRDGWELHYFADDENAVASSWLATGSFVILAGIAFIIFQIQHEQRITRALVRSEKEEIVLRQANERLAIEVEERRTAEQRLKHTKRELEQASRLAALGQLAASVTHELGQPIAAMRNHLAAAEIRHGNEAAIIPKIGGLVNRMEGITRQLKFFARTEREAFDEVDLGQAMQASLALVAPNIDETGAKIVLDIAAVPVILRGNRLRIEQVMINVLRNALDAVEDSNDPRIWVQVGTSDRGIA